VLVAVGRDKRISLLMHGSTCSFPTLLSLSLSLSLSLPRRADGRYVRVFSLSVCRVRAWVRVVRALRSRLK
jgi:hypothetical protein